jgi:hypothetical protein
MSDFEKKIEELNNKNQSIFNEIFGRFGKKKSVIQQPGLSASAVFLSYWISV